MAVSSLGRLLLLPSLFAALSAAAPWIVTADYEEIITVYSDYYGDYTQPAETYTDIVSITAPSGAAISTSTITETDEYSGDLVTLVEVLYPYNAAATPTSTSYNAYATTNYNDIYTYYYVNITYTAPTGCSSKWTYTTAAEVDPPYAAQDYLVPTSVSTSYYTDNSSPFQPTVVTEVMAYLNPTQLPASSMSYLSEEYGPYPTSSCTNPADEISSSDGSGTGSGSGSSSGTSSGSSSGDSPSSSGIICNIYFCSSSDSGPSWINDSSMYGISPLAIILISVLGWTFVVFVIGLFENYFHFQRLMKGWQSRRGLPITWMLWAFPLSFLVCFWFSRRGFQARSEEDAAELTKQWQERGFWNKMKLWLRYGFTLGYPAVLRGPAPPRVGRPLAQKATQPLLRGSAPGSETAVVSRQPSPRGSDGGEADVENTAASAPQVPLPREMSGGLPIPVINEPSSTVAEDEITEAPAVPTTTTGTGGDASHVEETTEKATEKPASEKGE